MQYNPHAPYILGNEWVPIRNAFYVPDRVSERGYTVGLDYSSVPVSGIYYVNEVPSHPVAQACDFISVYPAGTEDRTGPIKMLHIPASGVSLSPNPPFVIDISAGAAALNNPSDNISIGFGANAEGESDELWVTFNVAAYSQQLLGKRILDVRIRYTFLSFMPEEAASHLTFSVEQTGLLPFSDGVGFVQATQVESTAGVGVIHSISMTDMNPFWNAAVGPSAQRDVYPWRFQELARFGTGYSPSTAALMVTVNWSSYLTSAGLTFMDLEVIYCEEARVLYGGRRTTNINISGALTDFYAVGPQLVRMRTPALATGATLAAGDYSIVLSHRDIAVNSIYQGAPVVHATRQYYDLPNLKGININQSLTEGDVFTTNEIDEITHLTLHTSSLIVTGVHAYGTSIGAPVYGTVTATQEIEDNPSSGTGVPYQQVRFYARRYADTTVPLQLTDVATGTSTVSISVADFDALTEIVDGWKEVTLRFTTSPTFPVTAGDVDWRWSAAGEVVGNQWQVLVASGPSVMPGVAFATALATGPATYGAPWAGNAVALTWQSPLISGTAEDFTSDAVLMFSQDPPAVSGFALTVESQAITGVTDYCGVPNDCVPTAISYVQASWTPFSLCDSFDRVEVDTWGTSTSGHPWSNAGGTNVDYDVTDGVGTISVGAVGSTRQTISSYRTADVDVTFRVKSSALALGAYQGVALMLRRVDALTYLFAELRFFPNLTIDVALVSRVSGTETTLIDKNSGLTHILNQWYRVRVQLLGNTLAIKMWLDGQLQPPTWLISTNAAGTVTAANPLGFRGVLSGGNTNILPVVFSVDDVVTTPGSLTGGQVEIQRRDSLSDWQTVMSTMSPGCVTSFSDYESRVGIESEYRIRTLNALDFAGPWVTGTATISAPGVTIGGDANSLLIFTSNQSPTASLAYTMQWEGQPIEQFAFPEASTVQLQRMFGKDFFTAFHPLERGGDEFERTLLVNAAAISLPSLANFRGLRDLAWADLDYVCVRDELGNRWFANVRVPSSEVRLDRTIYMVKIIVVEVSNTPAPADPADL